MMAEIGFVVAIVAFCVVCVYVVCFDMRVGR